MEGRAEWPLAERGFRLLLLHAKPVGAMAMAVVAFVGFFTFPAVYLLLTLCAVGLTAILVGLREEEGSAGFITGLVVGWVGFTLGTMAGWAVGVLWLGGPFDAADFFPDLALGLGNLLLIGVPIGFATGALGALVVASRVWVTDRQHRAWRRLHPVVERDDPNDPFGWRKRR